MLYFWFVTLCGLFYAFVPSIARWIVHKLFNESDQEVNLKKELRNLIKERSSVNPVETFAVYARINRKIDRVRERLGEINQDNFKYIYKIRLIATVILYGLISLVNFYLIWNYRTVPLLKVPSNWLDPFGKLALQNDTGLGLIPWLVISASMGRVVMHIFKKDTAIPQKEATAPKAEAS
ncbi:tail-anchored protein insertion receptor WRB-like [Galendromus occidentalis]|uniref:Guided entry of tail-anchored proteins factor 1 n=1 Tax=Galendromus occidentalis TaxID=34638 RepID=A0AAJ6VZX5_9ACAR|nr:tail-anchored protein insertion receptor WRB-like [Galendromus occidentalis]